MQNKTMDNITKSIPEVLISLLAMVGSAVAQPPWATLQARLSSEAILYSVNQNDWLEQCVQPFADLVPPERVSNYQLYEQPSGLCTNFVSCSYEKCVGPFDDLPESAPSYDSSLYSSEVFLEDDRLNLPMAVVHPQHAGDVSETLKFAVDHGIEISVKATGHSYTGSATKKGTILLNLSQLRKYSPEVREGGFLIECDNFDFIQEGAFQDSCELAIARNKPAVIRVGGGEIADEVVRAVAFDWNGNDDNTRKYHPVPPSAGTVGAAGGWLGSGGLASAHNMRTFGIGIDQVLHVEMVLPDGKHVRFGPSEWENNEDNMYTKTTAVTGYCNVGVLSEESAWDWKECTEDVPNFDDLWYAVRGGGGGAYGVVTSVYYQVHDLPGNFQVVTITLPDFQSVEFDEADFELWMEFLIRFLFIPESLDGVTEDESNSCDTGSNGGFQGGIFWCYNGGGDAMKAAWDMLKSENSAIEITVADFPYAADFGVLLGQLQPFLNVPQGRVVDLPSAAVKSNYYEYSYTIFPLDALVHQHEAIIEILKPCFIATLSGTETCSNGNVYTSGGRIPYTSDGMDALSTHRRFGGFMMRIVDNNVDHELRKVFYGVGEGVAVSGEDFPGSLDHGHAGLLALTPLKEDWTRLCDPTWSMIEQEQRCYSFQEATLGTAGLKKLERIHADIDPHKLFNCPDCVEYSITPTPPPTPTPTPTPTMGPEVDATDNILGIIGGMVDLMVNMVATIPDMLELMRAIATGLGRVFLGDAL